jgi:hypothetical protein
MDTSAWVVPHGGLGGEIVDLCAWPDSNHTEEASHWLARVWSNTASAAGQDPCVPSDATIPYFNVLVTPHDMLTAHAGDTVHFTLTGWSTDPALAWSASTTLYDATVAMTAALQSNVLSSGTSVDLAVIVPAGAQSGDYAVFRVDSVRETTTESWLVAVTVN